MENVGIQGEIQGHHNCVERQRSGERDWKTLGSVDKGGEGFD